ncbi:unnamed protein product [Schistosoma curassoni]|uniref:DUF3941 domain-containing protein n=1 Tax=Schistosoma curassoni TaxID=6186 RepID=A0A183KUN7_9TREM|nr:unnamed protein product [Schistosoma curassoni]
MVLGRNKHGKECVSIETLAVIQEMKNKKTAINNSRTRTKKVKTQVEYSEANKQVERTSRADKQKYVEDLETGGERAAREGNIRKPYDNRETGREM